MVEPPNFAVVAKHRRDGDLDVNDSAVAVEALRPQIADTLSTSNRCQETIELIEAVQGHQHADVLSEDLPRCESVETLCGFVPRDDDAINGLPDDGVIRGRDERPEERVRVDSPEISLHCRALTAIIESPF